MDELNNSVAVLSIIQMLFTNKHVKKKKKKLMVFEFAPYEV